MPKMRRHDPISLRTRRRSVTHHAAFALMLRFLLVLIAGGTQGCAHPPKSASERGVTTQELTVGANVFTVVRVDLNKATVHLFWKDPDGGRYGTFEALDRSLTASRQHLLFAANAGIFDTGFIPCGLHIEDGRELTPFNLNSGVGNFYLKPNGVLLVDDAGAAVVESTQYRARTGKVLMATQSGPMLVVNGTINRELAPNSTHRQIRNGVGVASPRQVVFVLSRQPVTFFELASVFKSQLNCPDALYLDGGISRFHLPPTKAGEGEGEYAGILAVTARGRD
jgi:uncharacterized protein YigE (DUF2233 family)